MTANQSNVITLPHPNLRQRSKRVGIITEQIRELIKDMEAATLDWEDSREHEIGVALAAVQIDVLLRVVVIRHDFENKKDREFIALINPEITKYEGIPVEDYEGCLSVKDIYGKVKRYPRVRVKALGPDGQEIRLTADGFLARVLQHEIDHTNGMVFIDHIKDDPAAFYKLDAHGQLKALNYDTDIKDNTELWN